MHPDSAGLRYHPHRMAKAPPLLVSSGSAPSANPIREQGKASMAKPEFPKQRLTVVYGDTDWNSPHSRIWQ
jgi:hypothetical protein